MPLTSNPLFAGAPEGLWELREDALPMAASHQSTVAWIRQEVKRQSASENGGTPLFFGVRDKKRDWYGLPLLPDAPRFFKIRMRVPGRPDVLLVFSYRDLYLVGFLHRNIWYVFDDADMTGSGHLRHPTAYKLLGFSGGYGGDRFCAVRLGAAELLQTHSTLSDYSVRKVDQLSEIKNALFRIMVVISEAVRFPPWLGHYLSMLRDWKSEPVDGRRSFSQFFQDWQVISNAVMEGPTNFVPGYHGFAKYGDLVRCLYFLLPNNRPPVTEPFPVLNK